MTTAAPERVQREPSAPVGSRHRLRRGMYWLLLAAPLLLVLTGAWLHRWVDEDGYINLRVVDQIFAGNGPVFNEGERVEAVTSPLWIALLVAGRLVLGPVLRPEWVAVVMGLLTTGGAFALAGLSARRLHPDAAAVLPLGPLVVAAIPAVWNFATAGLEMGLVWLWVAASWWVLLRATDLGGPPTGRARTGSLVVLGLGPLVRPDLTLMAAVFLGAWVLVTRSRGRRLLRDVGAALALPLLYQVFRMGYYASLVPNTGLAKGASDHFVFAGVDYLEDLVDTYWLWVPLVPIVVALGITVRRATPPVRMVVGAMVGAGLLHGAYIVYIGGDYLHGRLLLPPLFSVAIAASVPVERRLLPIAASVVAVAWVVVVSGWVRYENKYVLSLLPPIADPRPNIQPHEDVVRRPTVTASLEEAAARGVRGAVWPAHAWFPVEFAPPVEPYPMRADGLLTFENAIGVLGYHAGTDVHVVDLQGLADPLSGRADVPAAWRRVAGHRKFLDFEWYQARFGIRVEDMNYGNASSVAAARRALACPPLSDLLDAVSEPLTVGRFLSNVSRRPAYVTTRITVDPREAEACRGT